jgi:hypothetical protein
VQDAGARVAERREQLEREAGSRESKAQGTLVT